MHLLEPLCNLLLSNEEEKVLANVCVALLRLLDRPFEHIDVRLNAEVLKRVAGLLSHSSPEVKNAALLLIAAIKP